MRLFTGMTGLEGAAAGDRWTDGQPAVTGMCGMDRILHIINPGVPPALPSAFSGQQKTRSAAAERVRLPYIFFSVWRVSRSALYGAG